MLQTIKDTFFCGSAWNLHQTKVIMPYNSNNGKWFKSKWKYSIQIMWESVLRRHRKVWQPQREKEVRCMNVTKGCRKWLFALHLLTIYESVWICYVLSTNLARHCSPLLNSPDLDFVRLLIKLTLEKLRLSEFESSLLLLVERTGSLLNSLWNSNLDTNTLSAE